MTIIQTITDTLKWINKDRGAAATWLRDNCEQVERYYWTGSQRLDLKAWTLRRDKFELPDDIEITIAILDDSVKAYCTDGIVELGSVKIRCQTKWRDAMCEAIFWAKGFVDGLKHAPQILQTSDDD